jgi:hypothetical protein
MRVPGSIFAAVVVLAAIDSPSTALASPVTINGITVSDQNIFADNRSINDVGIAPGGVLQFGVNISGGSTGYSGAGIFTATGSTTPTLTQGLSACVPPSTDPLQCVRTTSFDFTTTKLNGTWDFKVQQGASGPSATFALPNSTVIPTTPVPFPASVTITNSANGVNPTIGWTLPAGFTPDAFRVQIYDRSLPLANGVANDIHTQILSPTATSYTIPTTLSTGQSLIIGDKYSINFQVITTRDGGPNSNNSNGDILTRSNSWFDFTPKIGTTTPSNIQLPMVDGATGVYHFNVGSVGPDSVTFIDPAVAVGYTYDIGTGDPDFASVILPNVGGGVFDLSYVSTQVVLDAGIQYFFPTGGVSEFKVTGIDPSADLDPADSSAFVTGLTFVSDGSFTGTMAPITEAVVAAPEPTSIMLLASSLLGFRLFGRWRKIV